MNVGELKKRLAHLPDEMPVVQAYEYEASYDILNVRENFFCIAGLVAETGGYHEACKYNPEDTNAPLVPCLVLDAGNLHRPNTKQVPLPARVVDRS